MADGLADAVAVAGDDVVDDADADDPAHDDGSVEVVEVEVEASPSSELSSGNFLFSMIVE